MKAAMVLEPLVRASLGPDVPVRVRCWDGSEFGPPDAPVQLMFAHRRALRRILWAPNELGFARAYVSGDVLIEGDLMSGLATLERLGDPEHGPGVVVDGATRWAIVRAALRLGVLGPAPPPPPEEVGPGGLRHRRLRHSKVRDATAIAHHYDVGNDFYALVLGPSMTYSCGYWELEPGDDIGLTRAQRAKWDLVARKLGLREGMRLLDVGCGWGGFVRHAAQEYGVSAVGVTLSREQALYARQQIEQDGLAARVQIRVQDYRDVDDGPYDAIASIGMAEHVGRSMLPTYAAGLFDVLRPTGRLLNHAITRRPGTPAEFSRTSFIDRYVFPDGELEPIGVMVSALEGAGFEVRDLESLREHYALTLRAWVANLEQHWDEAVRLTSPGRARVWRLYLAGSALGFESNRIGVSQVLAVRPDVHGASGMPRTRAELLRPHASPCPPAGDGRERGVLSAPQYGQPSTATGA